MINGPLDEAYFEWLTAQVVDFRQKNPRRTHWLVLRVLFSTEFVWRVHNDENRVADGKELRSTFLDQTDISASREWCTQGCSFLEMLIALSGRLTFQTEGVSPAQWFWQMLLNANLAINDHDFEKHNSLMYVSQVLQSLNDRTYDANGRGGLFPLQVSEIDQRTVELFYQMNYYLLERS